MKKELLLAVGTVALLFGCLGGGGPSQEDYETLRTDNLLLQRECSSINGSLENLTQEYSSLSSQKAALEAEKQNLTIQLTNIRMQTGDAAGKMNSSKNSLDAATAKLKLYSETKTLLALGMNVSQSTWVDQTIKIRALNDSQLNSKWDAVLDCGPCEEASRLQPELLNMILNNMQNDLKNARSSLE